MTNKEIIEKVLNETLNNIIRYELDKGSSFTGHNSRGSIIDYKECKEAMKEAIQKALSFRDEEVKEEIQFEKDTAIEQLKCQKEEFEKMIEEVIPTNWLHSQLDFLLKKSNITAKDIEDLLLGIREELLTEIKEMGE